MSNEEYWIAHELGEMCKRKRLFFIYPADPDPKSDAFIGSWPNVISMNILDAKQKRGRLIVGGRKDG